MKTSILRARTSICLMDALKSGRLTKMESNGAGILGLTQSARISTALRRSRLPQQAKDDYLLNYLLNVETRRKRGRHRHQRGGGPLRKKSHRSRRLIV